MKQRSILQLVFYSLGGIALVLSLAVWVFITFFFEDSLNKAVIPQIEKEAYRATKGKYSLKLDKISYAHGTLVCNSFILSRVAYDSSEHFLGLKTLIIDSARFEGISWWDVLWGNQLKLSLQLNSPKVYLINIDSDIALPHFIKPDTLKRSRVSLSITPLVTFDSVILRDISVFLPIPYGDEAHPSYRNISIILTDFSIDLKNSQQDLQALPKHIDFEFPGWTYPVGDSMYSLEIRGIRGSIADSIMTIDTIAYVPNYSEQSFADKNKYLRGRLDFKCTGISIRGIDFSKFLNGGGLQARACEAASWYLFYYGDRRKPRDPHPPDALMPNNLINGIEQAITLDSIILQNGSIKHQERDSGSARPSLLTLSNARAIVAPFCTDTSSAIYSKPLRIAVSALFLGQEKVEAKVVYPIHNKKLDFHIEATGGPFDLSALNSYLVTNERKEITKGRFLGGELRMDVKAGSGVTRVIPHYTDLSIKVLPSDAKESGGIIEGIKSFVANALVLRTNNVDNGNQKAFSGTTTYTRSRKEEFFEFIWYALRKSLQKVIGF